MKTKNFLISIMAIFTAICLFGCSNEDSYPSILTEDMEIVIRFDNQTAHNININVNDQSWYVEDFTIDPNSMWEYSLIKKRGEQDVFILPMKAFEAYIDNIKVAYISAQNASKIAKYVPLFDTSFSVAKIDATKDAISKSIYTFTITEETIEAWKSINNL